MCGPNRATSHGPIARQVIPEGGGMGCGCKAMGTILHSENVRPMAQWSIDGANRG